MEEELEMLKEWCRWNKELKIHIKVTLAIENLLKRYKELEEEHSETNIKILSNAGIYQLGFNDGRKSSIPISVIQNTLDDINEKIEEFTKNVVTTKGEIEQEYWKSESNKAIAKRNVLKEILEKGNK